MFGAFRDDTVWNRCLWGSNSAVIFTTKQNVGKLKTNTLGRGSQLEQLIRSIKAKHITNNCLLVISQGACVHWSRELMKEEKSDYTEERSETDIHLLTVFSKMHLILPPSSHQPPYPEQWSTQMKISSVTLNSPLSPLCQGIKKSVVYTSVMWQTVNPQPSITLKKTLRVFL